MNNPLLLDVKHLISLIDIFKICGILYTRSQGKDLKTGKAFKMKIAIIIMLILSMFTITINGEHKIDLRLFFSIGALVLFLIRG